MQDLEKEQVGQRCENSLSYLSAKVNLPSTFISFSLFYAFKLFIN